MRKVAVVGGGLAGMVCAESLATKGFNVHVFDMGRRATGGRSSVRHTQEVSECLRARERANTRSTQTRDPFHPRRLHPI